MAGPVPMALGRYQFEALPFGFEGQDRSTDTPWAELNTAFRLNENQWTGPGSITFDITGVLFPEALGGLSQLEGLRREQLAGKPLMLVTGAGGIHGMHIIENISEGRSYVNHAGLPRKLEYSISLKAYDQQGRGGGGLADLISLI